MPITIASAVGNYASNASNDALAKGASMVTDNFAFLRKSAIFTSVAVAAVGMFVFLITLVNAPAPSIAQGQDTQKNAGKVEAKTPMGRCMDTWDRASQMSKQEWRETCKRTIKENPGLYNKAF